tara:strand:+ start:6450 stop:6974 length:525 start_codon:yes stop_codon:yes gene_type:complete
MSSYRNRNPIRQRSRDSLDRRVDQWINTGKQVVDGVAGNRPGQRRAGWQDKANRQSFEKVGRWMEEKIDWFFEDDDDWLDHEDLDSRESIINTKRPLGAISLRAPKALPSRIEEKIDDVNGMEEWPDDKTFKLNRWERKNTLVKRQAEKDLSNSLEDESSRKRRNIPKSSRRKY